MVLYCYVIRYSISYCIHISEHLQNFSNSVYLCRPVWEGGMYDGDEKSRLGALRLAMELGADHIDVELKVT